MALTARFCNLSKHVGTKECWCGQEIIQVGMCYYWILGFLRFVKLDN